MKVYEYTVTKRSNNLTTRTEYVESEDNTTIATMSNSLELEINREDDNEILIGIKEIFPELVNEDILTKLCYNVLSIETFKRIKNNVLVMNCSEVGRLMIDDEDDRYGVQEYYIRLHRKYDGIKAYIRKRRDGVRHLWE